MEFNGVGETLWDENEEEQTRKDSMLEKWRLTD